ncbi:MAG: DUF4956 domain-containing protein [Marvinbryantia sp.]|uniref:DUF4956 domain-containing protein n=1 Tax=Marvinbryantia sp. TaxID=2496532 RepID=UPI00399B8EA4
MKDYIIENFSGVMSLGDRTAESFFLNIIVALVIGMVIYIAYRATYTGVAYSKRFNISLVMMTLISTMVMTVISNNIALSLGMVGALSIVRFRTAVKDARDTAFIFWTIAVGICCGVSQYTIAALGTIVLLLFLIIMGQVHEDGKYMLIIRCTSASVKAAESVVFNYIRRPQLRVRNEKQLTAELIYEIGARPLKKALDANEEHLLDKLLAIEGVETANLVSQTDDFSR